MCYVTKVKHEATWVEVNLTQDIRFKGSLLYYFYPFLINTSVFKLEQIKTHFKKWLKKSDFPLVAGPNLCF